ncbi:MAG: ATP-binding protein [Pseudomonadota bacterium]
MQGSLGHFLKANSATLDNCASEALHLSGAIQNLGALVALDVDSQNIVAASDNIAALLATEHHEMLIGTAFAHHFPMQAYELDAESLETPGLHVTLSDRYPGNGQLYDVTCHRLGDIVFVEFIPAPPMQEGLLRDQMRMTQRACNKIARAESFGTATQIAADAMRKLTGLAKCMVYQFMPDWSGRVIAESRAEHMPSYLNLFFPAHDIPAQARHLYSLVTSRSVSAVDDHNSRLLAAPHIEQLDLTYSMLRSVSAMHTAYFRNMGLQSSFSVGLTLNETLWGLMVCHHDAPGFLPVDVRRLAEDLAAALIARLSQEQHQERAVRIQRLRSIETSMAADLKALKGISSTLQKHAEDLRTFMDADGFAAEYNGQIITAGRTPPSELILEILKLGIKTGAKGYFMDAALPNSMPEALEHRQTACGVFLQPVKLERDCLLAWFRGPVVDEATWAGDPNDKPREVRADGTEILSPRNSFETWKQAHINVAQPWTDEDASVAQSMFQEILDLIAEQATSIRQLNLAHENLASFTQTAVHDIRAPLRTISFALEELRGSVDANTAAADRFRAEITRAADVSIDRLNSLMEQVLAFVEIGNTKLNAESVELADVVDDVEDLLSGQLRDHGATLTRGELPSVIGNRALLTTAIQNLVQNAISYRHAERDPVIDIRTERVRLGRSVQICVSDNGIGVDPQHAERIFQPFKRLHRRDEIEGTGIGLATVHRVAALHHGTAWLDISEAETAGSRFVIEIPGQGSLM